MSKALASRFICNFSVRQLGLVEETGTAHSIRHEKRTTKDRQTDWPLCGYRDACLLGWILDNLVPI
jgi:hypothetical protein